MHSEEMWAKIEFFTALHFAQAGNSSSSDLYTIKNQSKHKDHFLTVNGLLYSGFSVGYLDFLLVTESVKVNPCFNLRICWTEDSSHFDQFSVVKNDVGCFFVRCPRGLPHGTAQQWRSTQKQLQLSGIANVQECNERKLHDPDNEKWPERLYAGTLQSTDKHRLL